MLNLTHVDGAGPAGLTSLHGKSRPNPTDDTAPVLDAFLQACDAEKYGTWRFSTLVKGIEWDPALFTRIVRECEAKMKPTLESASIFT